MRAFPMFFRTTGRRVIIVGGGEQAAQKTRLIRKTDAEIVLAATELEEELRHVVRQGGATHHTGPLTVDFFKGAALTFVATGCPGLDASVHVLVHAARCPVNVVDQPGLCDVTTPSIVDRDPVVVAIGTEGTGPVLARQIKTGIEESLPQNLGGLAQLAGDLRPRVTEAVPRARRRAFWRWVFAGAPRQAWDRGDEAAGHAAIDAAIGAHGAPDDEATGRITLVGAGPGAPDLLTLRAVRSLQEADVIYIDQGVNRAVLELARRDAERITLPSLGGTAWRQNRIAADARRGNRVVHLVAGDATDAFKLGYSGCGVTIDVVPGVAQSSAGTLRRSEPDAAALPS